MLLVAMLEGNRQLAQRWFPPQYGFVPPRPDRLISVRGTTPENFAHEPVGNLIRERRSSCLKLIANTSEHQIHRLSQ